MKSLQPHNKSSQPVFSRRRVHKGFAAVFAAALVLGLGVESMMAQGPYYPQTAVLGGTPFEPNGVPVFSDPDLLAINVKLTALYPTKSLVIPLPAGKFAATSAEYTAAVEAVMIDIAGGSPPPGVTLTSFAAEVAKYRGSGVSDVSAALGAIASGVIAGGGTLANLTTAVTAAAAENPSGLVAANYQTFLTKVAADNTLVADVDTLVAAILNGAASTSLGASAVQPAALSQLLSNAVIAINAAPVANAATATNVLKKALIEDMASSAAAAIVASPVLNTSANLDQVTFAVTNPSSTINLNDMLMKIIAAAGAAGDDIKSGAIALGALRNPANQNLAGYAIIKGASGNAYKDDVVDAYDAYGPTYGISEAAILAGGLDPAAVAAAGALKFPGIAATVVKDALIGAGPGLPTAAELRNIVARGVAASQGSAVAIATLSAVGFGGATPADIAAGAITGGQIGDAGAISKAVIQGAGLTPANATAIGGASITAAAAASPANPENAFGNIAYNLGVALGAVGAAGDARSAAAVTAMVTAISAVSGGTDPTYIAVVAALAGNANKNSAAMLAAGTAADTAFNGGAYSAPGGPIAAGAALSSALIINGPSKPLENYSATLNALTGPTTDARNLALLYAASLANSTDAAGGLAAVINNTTTSPALLTQAAISANRGSLTKLAVAGEVASFVKTNIATINIQAYIGERILTNPTLVKEIAIAGTVVIPEFSHFIAHTVGFNAPQQASQAVGAILNHTKFTYAIPGAFPMGPNAFGVVGPKANFVNDRPSAIAAISAGVTTGIIESKDLSAANRQIALKTTVSELVKAVITGAVVGSTVYNDQTGTIFRRSTGLDTVSSTNTSATGYAGAVTGFVAQMATPTVYALPVSSDLYVALAAIKGATAAIFHMDLAQAAAQAFAWVSSQNTAAPAPILGVPLATAQANLAVAAANIAAAFGGTAAVTNAVTFGINEALNAIPGAGARGLRDLVANPLAPAYDHHSAQGRPVSNIFTL